MHIANYEVLKHLTLLYVEDDAATREELSLMLRPWCQTLWVAPDGQEGLALFEAHRPDVVVTDVQMPRLNGLAMVQAMRQQVPEQRVVVVSAYNDTDYLFKAIELGVDHYVTKPVDVLKLLDKLALLARHILALREKERTQVLLAQYKSLVDQSAIVCKSDAQGRITYVNDKLCELSGFREAELVGQPMQTLRHPSEPPDRLPGVLALARSGQRWNGLVRNRTRGGDLFIVESNVVPVLNEAGQLTEVVSLDVDVTSHHKVHASLVEALSESDRSLVEQRHFFREYKRALELTACICVVDRRNAILNVNQAFAVLTGHRPEALKGRPISVLMPDEAGQQCLEVAQRGHPEQYESRIVRMLSRDGGELSLSVGFVGLSNLAGEVESVLMVCQDITESARLGREIMETQRELLFMLGDVVETRSLETGQHVRRVAQVARYLALKAGLSPEMADMIEAAAPMHDIGKVGIADAILNKPGKYEPAEFEEMKKHANIGHTILSKIDRPLIGVAAAIAHEHHERYDGQGYPRGLKGQDIALEARIVSIADVLDALMSDRVYKPAWSDQRTQAYFQTHRGTQFDPHLVDLLLTHWDAIQSLRRGVPIAEVSPSLFGELT
jgi:PAS domain S-box-containing protein